MNLLKQASALTEYWSPVVVGQVNNQYIKVAKIKGEFTWHKHDAEDEMFLVLEGRLAIEYEDHTVELDAGEFHVVPSGVMHNPRCEEECLIALIETVTTEHTGDIVVEKTKSISDQVADFK